MMKKLIFACLISMLAFACQNSSDEKSSADGTFDPQLVLTDSVQIDYLGSLGLMDIHKETGNMLLYDYQKRNILVVDKSGTILKERIFLVDERDGFGEYFYAANFFKDDILITSRLGLMIYDQTLNFKEKRPFDRHVVGTILGGNGTTSVYESYLFSTSLSKEDEEVFKNPDFMVDEEIFHILNLDKMETVGSVGVPDNSHMAKRRGRFEAISPPHVFDGDKIHVLYPFSPEIYTYDLSEGMMLIDSFALPSLDHYVPIQEPKPDNFGTFFADLASSKFRSLARSNNYWVMIYEGAAPQDEVDALPRNVVGDERYMSLYNKYKKSYLVILNDKGKVKEMEVPIVLRSNKLYSKRKLQDVDKEEVESDFVTFYFYEVEG